jgi:hypothetical protein
MFHVFLVGRYLRYTVYKPWCSRYHGLTLKTYGNCIDDWLMVDWWLESIIVQRICRFFWTHGGTPKDGVDDVGTLMFGVCGCFASPAAVLDQVYARNCFVKFIFLKKNLFLNKSKPTNRNAHLSVNVQMSKHTQNTFLQ